MAIEIQPIHPEFAAEISGIELARSVDPTMVDRIWEAIDRYAVLVFHDQHLDDEGLRDFDRQQFWIAARRWTMRAIEAGLLSVDCLKASHTSVHAA